MRATAGLVLAGLLLLCWGGTIARGQKPQTPRIEIRPQPDRNFNPLAIRDLRQRLVELDRLLAFESLSRAESLLNELAKHSALKHELMSRRIRLAQLKGDHEQAVQLCREALAKQESNPTLWRPLGASLLALDRPIEATDAITRYLAASPQLASAGMVAVEMLRSADQPDLAVGLVDSLRLVLGDTRYLSRDRAMGLLESGQQAQAAGEISRELKFNPFNLSLIRTELLEGVYEVGEHNLFLAGMVEAARGPGAMPAEVILGANLLLTAGDGEGALKLARRLLQNRQAQTVLLQNSVVLTRELAILDPEPALQGTVDYLLAVFSDLVQSDILEPHLVRRTAGYLAAVCEQALDLDLLGPDPTVSVARFTEVLQIVRQVDPGSRRLYSSQIKLAGYTRDVLGQPGLAARKLEVLLADLNLTTEGVALVRLTLGECYLAAGDTAAGRVVLTRLGRDPNFRQAAGHAHYHLARLDLAEGHFITARDRFAAVALDNPAAPYANDALELGLAVAEELENPSGGPTILQMYAQSVYYDLVAHPDSQLAALEEFITVSLTRLNLDEPQHLLERARFQLAGLYEGSGRPHEAIDRYAQLAKAHPDGRLAAESMDRQGQLLLELDRHEAARKVWGQLLAQYPTYLFIDGVRDHLRALP